MAKRNTFTKIGGGVFKCMVCKRGTRYTGVQSIGCELCPECFELAGIDNMLNDDGRGMTQREVDEVAMHIQAIEERGGDVMAAMASCPYIWKPKVARNNDGWTRVGYSPIRA